ncbi:hypothetical protein ACP3V3_02625 [Vibrio sp. PNB22_3_1]
MDAKTYKVTFIMAGKMAKPIDSIHLDGLLSAARTLEDNGDWTHQHDIPVERLDTDNGWCFKASSLKINAISQYTSAKTNKMDITELAAQAQAKLTKVPNKVSTSAGKYKADLFFDSILLVDTVEGYVVTDSPDRVLALLKKLKFIGARTKLGLGGVNRVDIEPALPEERDAWQFRHLPIPLGEQCHPSTGQLRAPYWRKTGQQMIFRKIWLN